MNREKETLTPLLLGACAGAFGVLAAQHLFRPAPPALPSVGAPLDGLNRDFHAAYDGAREDAALDAPVLMVLADTLLLFRRKERQALSFTPPAFHVLKSVAHGPVALFAALHRLGEAGLRPVELQRMRSLAQSIEASLAALPSRVRGSEGRENLQQILERSQAFVASLLAGGRVASAALAVFSRDVGPLLLRATEDATRLQLDALNAQVTSLLGAMTPAERAHFQVVVTGDHQARIRSLAMQYFGKLLGEGPAAFRLTYAEGVVDEAEALALVGTRRLDRAVAEAFFGDGHKLQRDVLGDAAQAQLRTLEVPRL